MVGHSTSFCTSVAPQQPHMGWSILAELDTHAGTLEDADNTLVDLVHAQEHLNMLVGPGTCSGTLGHTGWASTHQVTPEVPPVTQEHTYEDLLLTCQSLPVHSNSLTLH